MRELKWVWFFIIFIHTVQGMENIEKHSLKCNMTHIHEDLPENADSIGEMFSQGIFYGRLRFNSFGFKWNNELDVAGIKVRKNHVIAAIGGSFMYKSAILNGFGMGAGIYASQAYGSLSDDESYLYKSGKGVFSRYDLLTDGTNHIISLAQAYLKYTYKDTTVKVGRQIVESFLTKSNDTKMIPNTFEGFTVNSTLLPQTKINIAYLTKQKLRDHSSFHHLLAVGDDVNDPYTKYTQNDDSAMHYGLGLSDLKDKGIDDRLIIVEAQNRTVENMTVTMNYTAVPELLSSAMLQADYRFYFDDWSLIPAVRVMRQFDNGAGKIGGANLKKLTQGYRDPESLDAALYGARVDIVEDGFKLRFAYTKVTDKADIVAPWRGLPTGGFTRAMKQYNWYANTQTYMVQFDYEFEMIPDLKMISRFAIQDFDDTKSGVQADSNVFTFDLAKVFDDKFYVKTRYAHVMGDNDTVTGSGLTKLDPSYDEIRFEINYLF